MVPDLDSETDAQDLAEVFDEDNTNLDEPRSWREEDAEQLEALPDVYDVISAVGDRDDDEARIAEEMDDDEIIAAEEDQDGADLEDDDLARRDAEMFAQESDLDDIADPNGFDPDDLDGVAELSADEVELEYVGDLTDLAHARSAAQPMESRRLSDEDLEMLDYSDDAEDGSAAQQANAQKEEDSLMQTHPGEIKNRPGAAKEVTQTKPEQTVDAHPKRHQEDLLDEGVEETFPASDPVSVKRIT
jgi:hypothetical protein